MKKFSGIMICSDLDGTLLKKDKSISSENLDAIEYFKSEGGTFTIITGRMPVAATDIYKKVNPNAPFGCINGGGIYDHKSEKLIWSATLPESVIALVEHVDKNLPMIGIQINTPEKIYFAKDNSSLVKFREHTGVPLLTCDYHNFNEPIAKILFADLDEENILKLMDLLNAHPDAHNYDFVRSDKEYYEILPKGENKGTVLLRLARHLGIDEKNTIAVGDHDNDAQMLQNAGVGFAVSNASPGAKAAADYITVSNEEHAIAKIIEELDKGNIIF